MSEGSLQAKVGLKDWERYHDLSQESRWALQEMRLANEAVVLKQIRGTAASIDLTSRAPIRLSMYTEERRDY
jgi:hypothetical protein